VTARVGVVFPGDPGKKNTWSGTPAGLSGGFELAGVSTVPINAEPLPLVDFISKNVLAVLSLPKARRSTLKETIRFSRDIARARPLIGVVQAITAGRAVRNAQPLDGLVQIGTGYSLDSGLPIVTFEDLTVLQAVELGYPEWQALSSRAVQARVDRQKRAYEHATACCLTTHWAADSVVRDYGVPPEKVHVVGVGRNHDTLVAERDWSSPRFLFVGSNWKGKNGDAVVRAFVRFRAEVGPARLDLVGDHPQLNLDGVHEHGMLRLDDPAHRSRVDQLLRDATCFVLPSRYEAAAIAYVEAGAAGLPCIGTNVGGAKELIGEAGRVVDPRDDEALFSALVELSDPETAARLGALATQRSDLFTWRAVAERVLRALSLPSVPSSSLAEFL
jgi:glycosyltransferase involved in cell wall biosynthesis